MSKPRESLDHDTWLQQGTGGPADDDECEPDDNVPDEADTDPDYD